MMIIQTYKLIDRKLATQFCLAVCAILQCWSKLRYICPVEVYVFGVVCSWFTRVHVFLTNCVFLPCWTAQQIYVSSRSTQGKAKQSKHNKSLKTYITYNIRDWHFTTRDGILWTVDNVLYPWCTISMVYYVLGVCSLDARNQSEEKSLVHSRDIIGVLGGRAPLYAV